MKHIKQFAFVSSFVFVAAVSFAEDNKTAGPTATQQTSSAKSEKKSRKKKAAMCEECGKPESECECHGKDAKGHEHGAKDEKHAH